MIDALVRPLRPVPAGLCVLLALIVTILYQPGPAGALLHVLALLVVLRYGYLLIEKRVWENTDEAIVDWSGFNQGFGDPLKQVAVIIVFAVVHGLAVHYGGKPGGAVALLLLNLLAPATVLVIALNGSLIDALNPARLVGVITRTGFSYAAACFVLTLFPSSAI